MDAAGMATAHVAGNSLGGWLAFELARRGRARSVCAISPAGGWPSRPGPDTWRLRLLFGRRELMRSVLRGKGAMPPKGGNASVSDLQAEAAMDYMLAGVR